MSAPARARRARCTRARACRLYRVPRSPPATKRGTAHCRLRSCHSTCTPVTAMRPPAHGRPRPIHAPHSHLHTRSPTPAPAAACASSRRACPAPPWRPAAPSAASKSPIRSASPPLSPSAPAARRSSGRSASPRCNTTGSWRRCQSRPRPTPAPRLVLLCCAVRAVRVVRAALCVLLSALCALRCAC